MSYNLGDTVSAVIHKTTYPWGMGDYTVRGFVVAVFDADRQDDNSVKAYRIHNTGIRGFRDELLTTTRMVLTEKSDLRIQRLMWRVGRIPRRPGARL